MQTSAGRRGEVSVYAIQNKRTGWFVTGTNKRRWRKPSEELRGTWEQITNAEAGLLYETEFDAQLALIERRCGKDYRVVEIKPLEVLRGGNND